MFPCLYVSVFLKIDWFSFSVDPKKYISKTIHCKCLQGFTGALQGFLRTGVLKLKGLHVAGVPCSSLQGFPVCITGKPL